MKRFYLLIFSIIFVGNLSAQPLEMFIAGNDYFAREDFERAAATYEQVLSQGYESSSLYYNLGNAYFRLGKIGYAILNYERGLKLSPYDEDIKHNLAVANSRTLDKIEEVPKIFLSKWWEAVLTFLTVDGWSLVVIFFYIAFLLSITFFLTGRTGRAQKLGFMSGSFTFAALLLSVIILISSINYFSANEYGVLLQYEMTAKQSPDSKGSDVFLIHEGSKFLIEDEVDGWSRIKLSDGKVGWLPNSSFELI